MSPAHTHQTIQPGASAEHIHQDPNYARLRLRLAWLLAAVLLVVALVFLPPLLNVSRFQRRITSNLSAALGRPVHVNRVQLSLLPLPGFTLENFVVDEDPAFGYEPILRANQVRATVRISSLWSHHVEFSRIALTETTSVNLVRLPNGRWNFEPVLTQASRIEAAPTGQPFSGPAPRFPYIEATGARVNFKMGNEKAPLSLSDADFALWLPVPRQWRFRLRGRPARTDVSPADAGLLRLEGILGDPNTRAAALAEVPIDLRADWQAAPLAGLSRLAVSRDAGLRGTMTLSLHITGTAGKAALAANLNFLQVRRSEFIPAHLVNLEAFCQASATDSFKSLSSIECRWPPADSGNRANLIASGSLSDMRNPNSAHVEFTVPALPASTLLDWLQAATPHPPTGLTGPGVLAGTISWTPAARESQPRNPAWQGELELSGEQLDLPSASGHTPVPFGDIVLRSTQPSPLRSSRRHTPSQLPPPNAQPSEGFELLPFTIPLGGRQPALLEGHIDTSGYTLHLTGSAQLERLLALAGAIPQFGEGLTDVLASDPLNPTRSADAATALRLDLTATRIWGHAQTWSKGSATPLAQPGPARGTEARETSPEN